jgi:hypothetical protein
MVDELRSIETGVPPDYKRTYKWEKNWGGYNDMPPNAKEISETEFRDFFFPTHYLFKFVETRQIYDNKVTGPMNSAILFFYVEEPNEVCGLTDVQGLMNFHDWDGKKYNYRYFTFGCVHEYEEFANPRMFEHHYRCVKCGGTTVVDSSG